MKKWFTFMCVFTVLFSQVKPIEALTIDSQYAIAIDLETNMVLYEKNSDEIMYPASMTKVVTTMVALEAIEDLDAEVVITEADLDGIFETGASAAYYQVGETTTYLDLLYGVLLPSGADACQALANNLFGGLEPFVEEMNAYANELGLENTHFYNSTGIHNDDHYTTAAEMAIIVMDAIQNETFLEIFTTRAYQTSNETHSWVSGAPYYAAMAGLDTSRIIGCKSGFTNEAQSCLTTLSLANNREVITVTGLADSSISSSAVRSTNDILDYLEESYQEDTYYVEGDLLGEFEVINSKEDVIYSVYLDKDITAYLPVGTTTESFTTEFSFKDMQAPIDEGQEIGTYTISYEGSELYTGDVVSNQVIEQTLSSFLMENLALTFVGVILFIVGVCFGIRYYHKYKKLYLRHRR